MACRHGLCVRLDASLHKRYRTNGMKIADLDIEQPGQLASFLERNGLITRGEAIRSQVLAGGVSNRTVFVERPNGDAWVLKQALAQLRVQVEWFSDPSRIHREAAG